MDTAQEFTHVGLCAGYEGIALGLKRVIPSLRTVAYCEIEAFACANLVAKMEAGLLDASPIWTDLKTFPWSSFREKVDILTGGYPCQPFSAAGKRRGHEDHRHLWPYIADGIAAMRPGIVFFENVEGHISLGLREVLADLVALGYRVENDRGEPTWGIFSAEEVGAPHQRKRVFILGIRGGGGGVAHSNEPGSQGRIGALLQECSRQRIAWEGDTQIPWPSRPGEPQHEWEPPRTIGGPCGTVNGRGAMGNSPKRQNNRRELRIMDEAQQQWRCGDNAADSTSQRWATPDASDRRSKNSKQKGLSNQV